MAGRDAACEDSDHRWSMVNTVGTSNLDWWSIARDNEVNEIVLSHSFGDEMNLTFRNDIEKSKQIELDQWRHRPFGERLDETLARTIDHCSDSDAEKERPDNRDTDFVFDEFCNFGLV